MLWPRVGERVPQWRRGPYQAAQSPRAAVVEVPLLFEAGMAPMFDATIAVVADEVVRHQRASSRGHLALDERAARQLSQEEKSGLATYTVVNDGSVEDLEGKLSAILEMLKSAISSERPAPHPRHRSAPRLGRAPPPGTPARRRRRSVLAILAADGHSWAGVVLMLPLGQEGGQRAGVCRSNTPALIRQQAAAKHLDPALIAGVIYAETESSMPAPRRPEPKG